MSKIPLLLLSTLLLASIAAAAPTPLWVSEPVQPGETVLVFGDGFSGCQQIKVARLADGPLGSPAAGTVSLAPTDTSDRGIRAAVLKPLQVRSRSVKFLLPAASAPGIFHASIFTPGGAVSLLINRPHLLWIQGDRGSDASHGGFVRIIGNCLSVPSHHPLLRLQGPTSALDLTPSGYSPIPSTTLHPQSTLPQARPSIEDPGGPLSPFSLQAPLPAALKPGVYRIYVHSGCGGHAGWSEPLSFRILPRTTEPGHLINVQSLGVQSDSLDSQAATIQQALDKAGATGGGVVYFPRGRYLMNRGLVIPPHVTLRGAGMGQTALCWKDTQDPPEALVRGSGYFNIEDLDLYSINYRHGIVADQVGPGAGHVRIRRVRLRLDPYRGHITPEEVNHRFTQSLKLSTGGGDSLRLGGEEIEVSGCDVYGAGRCLYLSRASGAWVHDNTLYNGRWGWYCISGSNGVIFENNQINGGDLMSTGGGLNCLDGSTVSQNVYYANNHLKNMFGWDREAMTTDAGGGAYYGYVDTAARSTLTLATDPKWGGRDWTGAGVFILDGKGQGQYRQVKGANGRTVTLDSSWIIPPDHTSVITITMLQRNYLFVNNTFEDAGVAIQMYGTSIGNIAYGNNSVRTGGFHNFGMNYDGIQPSWFVQWLHNRISEGNVFGGGHDQTVSIGEAHLGVFALPPGNSLEAPLTLCGIVRGNTLENNAHLEVGGSTPPNPGVTYPYVQEVIVEKNRVENASFGLRIARASLGVLSRENSFLNCGAGLVDELEEQRKAATLIRKWAAEPGPLLHLAFDQLQDEMSPDSTGHGFHAACEGSCRVVPGGVRGGCLLLDGKSSLTVSHPNLLNLKSYTLSVWVNLEDTVGRWGFLSKRVGQSQSPFILGEQDGRLSFEATDSRTGVWTFNFQSAPLLKAGTWYHLAAVEREGQGVTLYLDGKEVAHRDNPDPVAQNDEPLCIGHEAWGGNPASASTPAFFKGRLDEVQVWARPLTPAEVAALAVR